MKILTKLMAMKQIFLAFLIYLPLTAFSQNNSPAPKTIDARLYDAYGKAYVDEIAQTDNYLLQRWTFYLDNAFYVTDGPVSKNGVAVNYPSVSVPDLANINILQLEQEQKMKRDFYAETVYQIEGTNKFLIYHSGRNFVERLNKYLNAKQQGGK
jgi:hypothetical protein